MDDDQRTYYEQFSEPIDLQDNTVKPDFSKIIGISNYILEQRKIDFKDIQLSLKAIFLRILGQDFACGDGYVCSVVTP